MRKVKSSSGDCSYINPYMQKFVGQEVITSKIVRKNGTVKVEIVNKIL